MAATTTTTGPEKIRNPYKFRLQLRCLADADTGGAGSYIEAGEVISGVSEEIAAKASATGVIQRTYGGVWTDESWDGKNDINGRPTK